ncbi:MAG: hypothetical protein JWO57_2477 [Pseudonocardiales bacterium]|nr:hypothetical protein [Pseudonocardiales bacterium]
MPDLLFIRPADDAAAVLAGLVGERLLRWVNNGAYGIPALSTHDLAGSTNATRSNVDTELLNGQRHLLYFGHGTDYQLIAGGVALVDGSNVHSLPRNAIMVAVACYSGVGLALTATQHVAGYLGWTDTLNVPSLYPDPMIDALSMGLLVLLLGGDLAATKRELQAQFAIAYATYQGWTGGSEAARLYARMAAAFASYCVAIEGDAAAVL